MQNTNNANSQNNHDNVLIDIQKLNIAYAKRHILKNITFKLFTKEIVAISGPNGGGKSTLLKALIRLVTPQDVSSIRYENLASDDIAYISQISHVDHLFPIQVKEVVAMGLCKKRGYFWNGLNDKMIYKTLKTVGLLPYADAPISELSGGQMQRMFFARMLLQDCSLIILDEPFAAVDAVTTRDLLKIVANLKQQGKSILLVVHDDHIIHKYCDRVILIAREVIADGRPDLTLTPSNLTRANTLAKNWETSMLPTDDLNRGVIYDK